MTYLALAFSSLKASTFSVVRLWKSFRWAILRSLIACLQASMNKGTLHGLFIFYKHRIDLGMVLFAISVRVSVNWAIGSSDRVNSSDNRDTHTVRKDIQSALSNLQCSAAGSSSLREVLWSVGSDHFRKDHYGLAIQIQVQVMGHKWDRYIRNSKGVMTVVSVYRFTGV